ncbi:MAG TPA: iron-sulfur cluster assembly protein, partial [Solirubrobacteraceae bacterium]|nr:iron-sulfur cluster assembly protein [Solirubrobacteraceae bacterium]
MPTKDDVMKALEAVIDPELRQNIVELGMVRSIEIHPNGVSDIKVSLTTAGCPIRNHFQTSVAGEARKVEGITHVNV